MTTNHTPITTGLTTPNIHTNFNNMATNLTPTTTNFTISNIHTNFNNMATNLTPMTTSLTISNIHASNKKRKAVTNLFSEPKKVKKKIKN